MVKGSSTMSVCEGKEQHNPVKLFVNWGDVSRGVSSREGAGSCFAQVCFGSTLVNHVEEQYRD